MSPEEASIHAYLCADGYVIKNPKTQKHKYYRVGFRNTNKILLKDFVRRFEKVFGVRPRVNKDRVELGSKVIVEKLLKVESFYSHEWEMPEISGKSLRTWLRAFFDCEAWVELQPSKSRAIRVDSVNIKGLANVQKELKKLNIKAQITNRRGRSLVRLNVCGKDNLVRFRKLIGFLHPEKQKLLTKSISSYVNYEWEIPKSAKDLSKFIFEKGRRSDERRQVRFNSIVKGNMVNLRIALSKIGIPSKISGPWKSGAGSKYYCLSINYNNIKMN